MAVTVTFARDNQGLQVVGRQHQVRGRLTLSGTYATGGFAISASTFGMGRLDSLIMSGGDWLTTSGHLPTWDSANGNIKLFQSTTGAPNVLIEVANTQSVAGFVMDVTVIGAL